MGSDDGAKGKQKDGKARARSGSDDAKAAAKPVAKPAAKNEKSSDTPRTRMPWEMPWGKTVLPFIVFVAVIVFLLYRYNPCDIKPSRRKDCGWAGISYAKCVTTGFVTKLNRGARFGKLFAKLFGAGFGLWFVSGYEPASLLWYITLSALAAFRFQACCLDDAVEGNVPHCYGGKSPF